MAKNELVVKIGDLKPAIQAFEKAAARIAELEAEVDRLRAGLRSLERYDIYVDSDGVLEVSPDSSVPGIETMPVKALGEWMRAADVLALIGGTL